MATRRNNLWLALPALLVVTLTPNVAHAGIEDSVVSIGQSIWKRILKPSVVPYDEWSFWAYVTLACSVLFLWGLWLLPDKWKQTIGRVGGFGIVPVAIMIGWAILGMVVGLGLDVIQAAIHTFWGSIPPINFFDSLVNFLSKITWYVVGFLLLIAAVKYVISSGIGHLTSLFHFMKSTISRGFESTVPNGYILMGMLMATAALNRPEINDKLLGFPLFSILGGVFGLYQIATKTVGGQKAVDKAGAKVFDKPMADGSWYCPNCRKVKKKVAGREVMVDERCGHLNPPEAECCMSKICDHRNPYAPWTCPGCNYRGQGEVTEEEVAGKIIKKVNPGKGMSYTTAKCPKCATHQPPRPKTTPFHEPGQDKYHAGTPGAPAALQQPLPQGMGVGVPAQAGVPVAAAGVQAPGVQQVGAPAGLNPRMGLGEGFHEAERDCPWCEAKNEFLAVFCASCGYDFMMQQPATQGQKLRLTPKQQRERRLELEKSAKARRVNAALYR